MLLYPQERPCVASKHDAAQRKDINCVHKCHNSCSIEEFNSPVEVLQAIYDAIVAHCQRWEGNREFLNTDRIPDHVSPDKLQHIDAEFQSSSKVMLNFLTGISTEEPCSWKFQLYMTLYRVLAGRTQDHSPDIIDDLVSFYQILTHLVTIPRCMPRRFPETMSLPPTCCSCAYSTLTKEQLFMTKEPPYHHVSRVFGAYTMQCLLDNFYKELRVQYLYRKLYRGPMIYEELWSRSQRTYDSVLLEFQRAIRVFHEAERHKDRRNVILAQASV